jgi:hypothetical protein
MGSPWEEYAMRRREEESAVAMGSREEYAMRRREEESAVAKRSL